MKIPRRHPHPGAVQHIESMVKRHWARCSISDILGFVFWSSVASFACATEYHVSPSGNDANPGSQSAMLRTISEGARRAQPGDTVTVHQGVYRERVNPPRGGTSDSARITYQAAPGETAVITGAEIVTGWQPVGNDTWTVTLPHSFFGAFNPFNNVLIGDWYSTGRTNHTGAVYLDGDWLTEATTQSAVLQPASGAPLWFASVQGSGYLLNVGWFQPELTAPRDASVFDSHFGGIDASDSEGSQCIGYIEDGDWTSYNNVDFGAGSTNVQIRAASAAAGGLIEVHLDAPDGTLLGTATVPNTGGWQTWQTFTAPIPQTSGTHTVYLVYHSANYTSATTAIWAQFPGKNPNQELVEVNVRQSVFYPQTPGLGYITIRGFTIEQAATPWAPPTAEQVAAIGTNWGYNWIIENNTVCYSTCCGISLGKYSDHWDNTATSTSNSANAYVDTINRAIANGWQKGNVGSHIVRNNLISHCEQTGIVGSMGGAFSTISDNQIHDIHVRNLFSGAEMAGIKLHGAVDTQILRNHIYNTCRGIWLDWMAQGTRISSCLLHDNSASQDLMMEVDHGPILIDHNIFLSSEAVLDISEGEAYAHNLIAGSIAFSPDRSRYTPYFSAHSTTIAGLIPQQGGDARFYNNIFTGSAVSLAAYNSTTYPVTMAGNVFLNGAVPSSQETSPLVLSSFNPNLVLHAGAAGYYFEMSVNPAWASSPTRQLVTTALMGTAVIPNVPFDQPDGSAWILNTDFNDAPHNASNPFPGPFETAATGTSFWKVSTVGAPPVSPGPRVFQRIHVDVKSGQVALYSGTPATILGQAGETWNSVAPGSASGSVTGLLNASGAATTVGLTWTLNHGTFDNGTTTGNYSNLMRDYAYLWTGGGPLSSTWTFNGLSPDGIYTLVMYAGNNPTQGGSWTVNGINQQAEPTSDANSLVQGQNYVRFDNVRPTTSGQIAITFAIRSGEAYGVLAALELDTTGFVTPSPITVQPGFNSGAFELSITGLDPARRYVLTRSADLQDGFPTTIGGTFSPTGSAFILSDPFPPAGQAFYRVELVP